MRHILKAAVLLAAASLSACSLQPAASEVDAQFRSIFKNMPVDRVAKSEIAGVYEIYSGGKLFYFAPDKQLMMFGEMYTSTGVSLTQEKVQAYLNARTLSIPEDVGTVVGDGPVELISFIAPDCGYCAQAHRWIEDRNYEGLRLRVFFMPMEVGTPNYARAQQFICAPPELRREALRQVYAHEDPAPGQSFLTCADGANQLARQAQIAKDLGVEGTPTFSLKGQTVLGFRQDRLEQLLSSTTTQ